MEEAEVEWFCEELQELLEPMEKRCPFHYRGLECKSRKSRDSWSNRQVGIGVQNEARQRLTEFCLENTLVIGNTFFQWHKRRSPHGQHQIVDTKIRLITLLAAEDGEALNSQQKHDQELSVAQLMNSLLPNSDLS